MDEVFEIIIVLFMSCGLLYLFARMVDSYVGKMNNHKNSRKKW